MQTEAKIRLLSACCFDAGMKWAFEYGDSLTRLQIYVSASYAGVYL